MLCKVDEKHSYPEHKMRHNRINKILIQNVQKIDWNRIEIKAGRRGL